MEPGKRCEKCKYYDKRYKACRYFLHPVSHAKWEATLIEDLKGKGYNCPQPQ